MEDGGVMEDGDAMRDGPDVIRERVNHWRVNRRIELAGDDSVQLLLDRMKKTGMGRIPQFEALLQSCSIRTLGSLGMFFANLPALCEQLFADVPAPLGHLQACGYVASIAVRLARLVFIVCYTLHARANCLRP